MTQLAQIIWDCPDIKDIMDKVVLMGWAEQVEEGSDKAYASKVTVADFLQVSLNTVKRRTKALLRAGWLVDTGEIKAWEADCLTPVYRINVEKIMECEIRQSKLSRRSNWTAAQNEPQGSRSSSRSPSSPPTNATAADLRSVVMSDTSKDERQTENPRTNPKTKIRTCPKCGVPWTRDKAHFCMAKPKPIDHEFDEDDFDDSHAARSLDPDLGGERIEVMEDGSHGPIGRKQGSMDQAALQKTVETIVREGRPTPRAAPLHDPPGSATPPIPCKGKERGCEARVLAKYQHNEETTGWRDGWCVECVERGSWDSGS